MSTQFKISKIYNNKIYIKYSGIEIEYDFELEDHEQLFLEPYGSDLIIISNPDTSVEDIGIMKDMNCSNLKWLSQDLKSNLSVLYVQNQNICIMCNGIQYTTITYFNSSRLHTFDDPHHFLHAVCGLHLDPQKSTHTFLSKTCIHRSGFLEGTLFIVFEMYDPNINLDQENLEYIAVDANQNIYYGIGEIYTAFNKLRSAITKDNILVFLTNNMPCKRLLTWTYDNSLTYLDKEKVAELHPKSRDIIKTILLIRSNMKEGKQILPTPILFKIFQYIFVN